MAGQRHGRPAGDAGDGAPVLAAQVAPARGEGTRAQRRALGLVMATIADLQEQAFVYGSWARPRRCGAASIASAATAACSSPAARRARRTRVSGVIGSDETGVRGRVRLAGSGVLRGRACASRWRRPGVAGRRAAWAAAGSTCASGGHDGARLRPPAVASR